MASKKYFSGSLQKSTAYLGCGTGYYILLKKNEDILTNMSFFSA
ncbi:MAG: hypothetical protein ACL93V_00560 [Candidatus Electrothrix sp. YB6]